MPAPRPCTCNHPGPLKLRPARWAQNWWHVYCSGCGAIGLDRETKTQAVRIWNSTKERTFPFSPAAPHFANAPEIR